MTPKSPTIKKPRPYWHVDAKWISGIVLLLLLSMTALLFLLWQITARTRGIDLLTTLLASSFSYQNGGLDDEGDVRLIRAMIAAAPNKQWQPSPGLDIIVHEADIEGMTPRQVRLWFFHHIAEPLYEQGPSGLTSVVSDPGLQASIEQSTRPLGFISARMHTYLLWVLGGATLFSLLFLGLLVRFSQGPGSLSNPGAVLFLAGLPGALLWGVLRGWLRQAGAALAGSQAQEAVKLYTQLAVDVLPPVIQQALQIYIFLTGFGLVLLLLALLAALFGRRKQRQPVEQVSTASSGSSASEVE